MSPSATITKKLLLVLLLPVTFFFACKKTESLAPAPVSVSPNPPTTPVVDSTTPLKDAADFPIGAAISYTPMLNDVLYAALVKRDFDAVTFDYNMKHGAIVSNSGVKDYSRADQLLNATTTAGLSVFGHTLIWYQNNNGDYLRSLATAPQPTGNDLLLTPTDLNGTFETPGSGTTPSTLFASWFGAAGGGSSAAFERETTGAQQGSAAVKITVTTPGANAWDVQLLNQDWKPAASRVYLVKFWVKALAGSGSFRAVNQTPNAGTPHFASYTVAPSATWTEVTWNYTAPADAIQFGFQFPSAGTYWIDNVSIREATVSPVNGATMAAKMDSVMKDWIQATVNHFKEKVHAWDVVNEVFTDGTPVLRNGTSTGDTYYWAQYLGRDYIARAFRYAREADPTADLFINDYNLESNPAKLDSVINLAAALKAAGVPVTGIGTQMHISTSTTNSSIDQMMQKLAATGLKIRVSELDIRVGNGGTAGTPPPAAALSAQAALFNYVVAAYKKHIPVVQRAGITVWGVTDNTSWLYNNGADYPLLYDKAYNRKPAYTGFLSALKAL